MKMTLKIFTIITILSASLFAEGGAPFVRYPALNSDGSKIAFSYQGDIWTASADGGNARRLTIHQAYEGFPVWSPDDKYIAFSSNRFGNFDVFTIPAEGGFPKRLTYYSTPDYVSDWTGNEIVFTTSRTFKQIERELEIYQVSPEGGTPKRILNALGDMPSLNPAKNLIAFVMGECRISREVYNGPANRDIWLYNFSNDKFEQLTDFGGQDIYPEWGNEQTLFYVTAKSGRYNLFKMELDENMKFKSETQLTNFEDQGINYLNVSKDGTRIIFSKGTESYILNSDGAGLTKIKFQIGTDYRFDPIEHKTFSSNIEAYNVSPNGKYSVFTIRGEVFVSENDKDKKRTVNLSKHPFRDQHAVWLSDSTIVFCSDRDGEFDLYLVRSADPEQPDLLKSLKHEVKRITDTPEDESYPVISPDGEKIAYEIGRGKLVVADISADGELSGSVTLLDGWDSPGNVSWSPDGKWLAYSLNDLNFNSEIYIHAADNSQKPVNVSMHPRGDFSPVWSPDGSKLGFISERNNGDNDIWFVWLKKSDWEKTKQDWKEENGSEKKKDKKKNDSTNVVEPIQIDFEGIYERLVQITSMDGNEGNLAISKEGKIFYFTAASPPNKGTDLFSIKWDKSELKAVTQGGASPSAVSIDRGGKYIYNLKSGGKLGRIKLSGNKSESLPFAAKMDIIFVKELEQIFEEAWRTLRDGFYDPNFHGKNWKALHDKYKPLCLSASSKRDFRDMFNLMLGELNASHMGLYGSDRSETQSERTALLGIEVRPSDDGIEVARVIPNSPADKGTSKLNTGDLILSVNGLEVTRDVNFYSLFINQADEKMILGVKNTEGAVREVVIRPISRYGKLLYDEWVKDRRKLVEKYSNGRLGYLHIQAMGWDSFERFERELTAAGHGKEGIVIDVRYNGGGWTTDYLMAVLNVKQHAYTIPRGSADDLERDQKKFKQYYPFAERLPFYPWTKPSIAICNASSYSNAEIFSHAYKTLGIGTLVGEPTFGAVISTGGQGLLDGSFVRLPFRGWFVFATEKNMELGPATPNIIVYNSPDSKAKGKDEQLKVSVEELLKQIDTERR